MSSEFAKMLMKSWKNDLATRRKIEKKYTAQSGIQNYGFPTDFKEFNKMIGYPINRNTGKQAPMAPYQIEHHDAIQKYHKVIVNKSRKIGITEASIRSIALNCFHRYAGHDIVIIAGNELEIAREILLRFHELFHDKPDLGYAFKCGSITWKESDLIRRSSIHRQHPIIEFRNGTRVFCFAASRSGKSQSFRGPDDIICILFSEAAHTGMIEDQPIMNALEPNLANRDDADLILESTPNGKRGFFYNYWMDIKEDKMKGWHQAEWDCHHGLNCGVLSKKFLADQKSNPRIDFLQEYRCKFTSTVTGIFKEEDISLLPDDAPRSVDLLKEIGRNYSKQEPEDSEF